MEALVVGGDEIYILCLYLLGFGLSWGLWVVVLFWLQLVIFYGLFLYTAESFRSLHLLV